MSDTNRRSDAAADMKLEVVGIPVTDVERAKRFYGDLGWRLDADFAKGADFRVVQFTPPGSQCSIHFGTGVSKATPGSASGLFLIVTDIVAAHANLVDRGVKVSEVFHRHIGEGPISGPDPERHSYASYASFNDPDGNTWLLQEVNARLPGRVTLGQTLFSSTAALVAALKRAAAAHGEHEKRIGQPHADWPAWYADYIAREQAGEPLPS